MKSKSSFMAILLLILANIGTGFAAWIFVNKEDLEPKTLEVTPVLAEAVEVGTLNASLTNTDLYIDETRNFFSGFEITTNVDITYYEGTQVNDDGSLTVNLTYLISGHMQNTSSKNYLGDYIQLAGFDYAERTYTGSTDTGTKTTDGDTIYSITAPAKVKETTTENGNKQYAISKIYPFFSWIKKPSDISEFKDIQASCKNTKFVFNVQMGGAKV